jgi:hypothetical protein
MGTTHKKKSTSKDLKTFERNVEPNGDTTKNKRLGGRRRRSFFEGGSALRSKWRERRKRFYR